MNSDFNVANAIKYQSNNYAGFTFSGRMVSRMTGFANNRAYSVDAGYASGQFKISAAYMQGNGVDATDKGAITGDQYAESRGFGLALTQR